MYWEVKNKEGIAPLPLLFRDIGTIEAMDSLPWVGTLTLFDSFCHRGTLRIADSFVYIGTLAFLDSLFQPWYSRLS